MSEGSGTMRAVVFREHGGPEVLELVDLPVPEPGPGEVRIRVRAASLNHLDLWTRRGLPIEMTMPHIGGSDIAGEVDAVGPGAASADGGQTRPGQGAVPPWVRPGARVVVDPSLDYGDPARLRLIGEHTQGGFAEYAVVPAANLVEIPQGVSFETAAAAGLVAVTAWRGLVSRAGLKEGESVLITGGSGGVSTLAIQIARLRGARTFVLTSGARNVERVRALGADEVYDRSLLTEGAGGDPEAGVRAFGKALWRDTARRGVDVILDSVGEALWPTLIRALAPMGRLVTYGATTGALGETEIRLVFWRQLSILGSTMGTPEEFREAMGHVFSGELVPPMEAVLPLEEVPEAHRRLEEGAVFGKIVITP